MKFSESLSIEDIKQKATIYKKNYGSSVSIKN